MEFKKATLQPMGAQAKPTPAGPPIEVQINPASLRLQMSNNVDMGKAFAHIMPGAGILILAGGAWLLTAARGCGKARLDDGHANAAAPLFTLSERLSHPW